MPMKVKMKVQGRTAILFSSHHQLQTADQPSAISKPPNRESLLAWSWRWQDETRVRGESGVTNASSSALRCHNLQHIAAWKPRKKRKCFFSFYPARRNYAGMLGLVL
jgi:hypothetical protein